MQRTRAYRYPIWSSRAILMISLAVLVTITVLVFALSDRTVFVETEITLLIISLCLFAFLTIGLYRGVRLERPDKREFDRSLRDMEVSQAEARPHAADWFEALFWLPSPHIELPHLDLPNVSDTGDDLAGCLMALVLWVAAAIALVVLLWVLAQVIAALPVIAIGLCWVFYRALRIVFAKSRICKGQLLRSMQYGLLYTMLYTGWIFVVLWVSHWLITAAL